MDRTRTADLDLGKTRNIIIDHQKKALNMFAEDDNQRILINRNKLVSDAFEQFDKRAFDCSLLLKICFVGEAAEDVGGPRREFFRLLSEQMFQLQDMFMGWPNNVTMKHNIEATATNKFFLAGKILSTIIIQGGQGPHCFSEAVADYLIHEKVCSLPVIEDVNDDFAQDCIAKVVDLCNIITLFVCGSW